MNIKSNIWFENEKSGFFGKGRIELLEKINAHGSISAAAKAMKMSYKAAWDAVNEMNNLSESPIVTRESGGKGGGGTRLTEAGHKTVALYKKLETLQKSFLTHVDGIADDVYLLDEFSKNMMFRTSARNQLLCHVCNIQTSKLGAIITLSFSAGEMAQVSITRHSFEEMNIQLKSKLFIILKSSWIRLLKKASDTMCNNIPCIITRIEQDADFVEVQVSISGTNTLTISLTLEEFEALHLKEKEEAFASFNPSDAILAI